MPGDRSREPAARARLHEDDGAEEAAAHLVREVLGVDLSKQQQSSDWGAAWTDWSPFSYPFNLSQQPAITVPCGLTTEGLPMGVQLVGPMFGDALVLQAAQALQACYPVQRPTLS